MRAGSALLAATVVGSAAALGATAYFLSHPPGSGPPPPPPGCPSTCTTDSDCALCGANYTCSSGACVPPSGGGGAFIFEVSGNVGSIVLNCPCDNTTPDLVFQVSGATPNGQVAFFLGPSLSELYPLYTLTNSGSGNQQVIGTADAFGNLSLPLYSCALYSSNGQTCASLGIPTTFTLCPMCGGCPCDATATLYLQAKDLTTSTFSDVIAASSTCSSCSGSTCCQQIL